MTRVSSHGGGHGWQIQAILIAMMVKRYLVSANSFTYLTPEAWYLVKRARERGGHRHPPAADARRVDG